MKRTLAVCWKRNSELVPQINLLGHQSWVGAIFTLLREHPEFEKVFHINLEIFGNYYTPYSNPSPLTDGLSCKSYPLHPDVLKIVFALVNEMMDDFETQWYHS